MVSTPDLQHNSDLNGLGSEPQPVSLSKLQKIAQIGHERRVCGGHGIVAEGVGLYPGERRMFLGHHHTLPAPAQIKRHEQVKGLIAV